ncbi:hypothetical protein FRC11_013254 [Ceratobasidium sp. 423]|nr:hypothetical protein FRC11_013254 [Ceratobasidium sp. 423]
MAREHPSIPKASSSQKQGPRFDGEDDEEEVNTNKQNKNTALAAKQSSTKDTSRLFVKKVNGREEGIKFYIIEQDIPWDLSLELREQIEECGGDVVDDRPDEGYTLVDPRSDDGVLEIASHSTQTRRSCMARKRFSIAGAGGRLTAPPQPRPKPPAQPGRKPGAPRTEFNEQDDRCLIAWMAYQFGKNKAGRQGNRPYQVLVQEPSQLWWTNRHPWHSWRERYKNKKAHFDPLIIQAFNDREKNKKPSQRELRQPKFSDSEDDSSEQENVVQEAGPSTTRARARPKAVKRKAQDDDDTMDEQHNPEPAKQIDRRAKRVKIGSQSKGAPTIKISASQKAREAPPLHTPSPPPREPAYAPPSPDPVSPPARMKPPREETPINRPEEGQEREDSQSSTQLENGILDEAVFGGGVQGVVERHNAELAKVAANEMEPEESDEFDDPDVDVVGVTQVETPRPIDLNASEEDEIEDEDEESKTESTGESGHDEEAGETGETVLDTAEERLSALADGFGAMLSKVEAYYYHAIESGMDGAAAYDFTEKQLRANSRLEKGKGRAS